MGKSAESMAALEKVARSRSYSNSLWKAKVWKELRSQWNTQSGTSDDLFNLSYFIYIGS